MIKIKEKVQRLKIYWWNFDRTYNFSTEKKKSIFQRLKRLRIDRKKQDIFLWNFHQIIKKKKLLDKVTVKILNVSAIMLNDVATLYIGKLYLQSLSVNFLRVVTN